MSQPQTRRPLPPAWTVYGVLLLGWSMFSYGYFWRRTTASWGNALVAHSPLVLILVTAAAWRRRGTWWPWVAEQLRRHTEAVDAIPLRRVGWWVAAAAGIGLFAELAIIRLHGSYFQLFAYFKNVSLLSCFLGLGIGYTLASRRWLATPLVMPALAAQILVMHLLQTSGLARSLQSPVTEELGFGITAGQTSELVAVYGFMVVIFGFNALGFVPLGQLASRLMARQDTLVAYGWNLFGSLLGIVLFNLLAYLWAPPAAWMLAVGLVLLVFVREHAGPVFVTATAALVLVGVIGFTPGVNEREVYSPYQKLTLTVHRTVDPEIRVNHVYYQRVLNLDSASVATRPVLAKWQSHYNLPYHFQPAPSRVLVVGAGTGNDVAAAVRAGAGRIDAVEIDPAILHFGRLLHPESPYQQQQVTAVVDDARAYIRQARDAYDLIVYGLLDSHTLLSGRAGVRLDSYVYTVEAFREARDRLAEGGLISLTFSLIDPSLGRKLYLMLEEAFDGERPVVYRTGYDGGFTFLVGDDMADRAFTTYADLRDVTAEFAASAQRVDLSTDDWPFFYMPAKTYPSSYVAMILVLLGVTVLFVREIVPGSGSRMHWPCFFLGAGFMLIETKGITELALVYGSTWTVIGFVIAGIMIMAFLANWFVARVGAPPAPVTYGLLLASILVGLSFTSARLGNLPAWAGGVLMTAALTLPLFFSGLAFSAELRRSGSVAAALSSNLLGAMLGGFLEYNSMYFGFRSLYVLALGMYALAFVTSWRTQAVAAPARPAPSSA